MCRSVGVSNFGVQHLEGLRKAGRPTPSVNQIELHPQMRKQDIVDYCHQHGITVMGYSPLAKAQRMRDKKLIEVAQKYKNFATFSVVFITVDVLLYFMCPFTHDYPHTEHFNASPILMLDWTAIYGR